MTQKELLYVEDAVEHEKSIINICNDALSKLTTDEFIIFMENEIKTHEVMKDKLLSLLKEKVNGQ